MAHRGRWKPTFNAFRDSYLDLAYVIIAQRAVELSIRFMSSRLMCVCFDAVVCFSNCTFMCCLLFVTRRRFVPVDFVLFFD